MFRVLFVFITTAAVILGLTSSQALAQERGLRFSLMGAIGSAGARVESSNTLQASGLKSGRSLSWGGGLLMEKPISPTVGIEIGALYLARKFEISNTSLTIQRSVPTLFVPFEARVWIGDVFSIAGGVFGATRTSDQTDEITSGNSATSSFTGGARKRFEYGMTVATALNLAAIAKTGFFAEARYNRGFTNASQDGVYQERINDVLLLVGVRLDFSQ